MKQVYSSLNLNNNKIIHARNVVTSEDDNQKIKTLTKADYDALITAGTIDADTFYVISDSAETLKSGAASFSTTCAGNDTDNFINIQHNLDKENVIVSVVDALTFEACIFTVEIIDNNNIKLKARAPIPATDTFNVLIIG